MNRKNKKPGNSTCQSIAMLGSLTQYTHHIQGPAPSFNCFWSPWHFDLLIATYEKHWITERGTFLLLENFNCWVNVVRGERMNKDWLLKKLLPSWRLKKVKASTYLDLCWSFYWRFKKAMKYFMDCMHIFAIHSRYRNWEPFVIFNN